MNKISLNTHDYDGKLNISKSLRSVLLKISNYDDTKKLEYFTNIKKQISRDVSLYYLNMIEKDIGTSNNIDNTNNLIAEDLVVLLCEMLIKSSFDDNDTDLLDMICFSLEDIKNGSCSQGRTTRLYQIIEIYYEKEQKY